MNSAHAVAEPRPGLFAGLLGAGFATLAPQVQALHGGRSAHWAGIASVRRGKSRFAAILNALAGMPRPVDAAPTEVSIDVRAHREIWTRRFGHERPLRSTLCARDGLLLEQMGLVTFGFQLVARSGGIDWNLVRVRVVGIALPTRLFRVVARSQAHAGAYRFRIATGVLGVGDLVAYEGTLHAAVE